MLYNMCVANGLTTEQVKNNNPKGIGGFGTNPQNRNDGGRYPRGESFTYWYNYFKNMSVADFRQWKNIVSDDVRTVVSDLAYTRMEKAISDLRDFQEVANRSEGRPAFSNVNDDYVVTAIKVEIIT